MKVTIDDEYDILMTVADYIQPIDGFLEGEQVTLFSNIINEFHKLGILSD